MHLLAIKVAAPFTVRTRHSNLTVGSPSNHQPSLNAALFIQPWECLKHQVWSFWQSQQGGYIQWSVAFCLADHVTHWFGTSVPAVAAFQCNSISTISDISKACLLQQSRMQQFWDYPIINSRKLPSPLAISSNPRTIFQDWYFSKRCLKNPNRSKCYLFIKLHWLFCLCPPRICSLSSDCGAFGVLVFSGSRFGWNCLCLDEGVLLESHPWIDKNVQWSTEKKNDIS